MVDREFLDARKKAVVASIRMDERAGLLSEALYFRERLDSAKLKAADEAREGNRVDQISLDRFVEWGLVHRRSAMLRWAEAAAEMPLSAAYQTGWQQTYARWEGQRVNPSGLSWLIAMWHRALVESDEQTAPVRFPR